MAICAGLWWFSCVAAGGSEKIDVRLQEVLQGQPDATVPVLIRIHGRAPLSLLPPGSGARQKLTAAVDLLRGTADATQSPIRGSLDRWGVRYRAFWVVNAIAAELTPAQLHALARREEVLRIDYDVGGGAPRPTLEAPAAKVAAAVEWNVTQVRAPEVWAQGYRGQGVVVAGADTGYQWDHPALRDRYRGWNGSGVNHAYHWHDAVHGDIPGPGAVLGNACGFDNPVPCDDDSHGTHTMGTVLGDDGAANQIGIAPDARWIACRNMEDGNGRPSTYIECFEWFMAPTNASGMQPDPGRAPHIISNSWSCPPSETCAFDALQETIEQVRAAGILVVVAAGNGTPGCSTISDPPAIEAGAFTVGATDNSDAIASFSLWGPVTIDGSNRLKPDVVAPGVGVRSAVPGNAYGIKGGTSMATPNVAGVAALMMSANPDLKGDPARVEQILRATAVPLVSAQNCTGLPGNQVPNAVFGYGRVDAYAAVQAALALPLFANGFE